MSEATKLNTSEFRKSVRIGAPATRIWYALTSPDELEQWFAEHADVDPRVGGRYALWGRHTLWGMERRGATQTIREWEPERRLDFSWSLKGRETAVSITLDPARDGTQLSLHHDLSAAGGDAHFYWLLRDHWAVALTNLVYYVERGAPLSRLDYAGARGDVTLELEIDAPADRVFEALTHPPDMDAWLSRAAAVDLRVGGRYSYGWTDTKDGKRVPVGPSKIVAVVPGRSLTHDWYYTNEEFGDRVTWEIEDRGDKSLVRLRHTGFPKDREGTDYTQGWTSFLHLLRMFLERGVRDWDTWGSAPRDRGE